MRVIDFHAHAFPDAVAPTAVAKLMESCREEGLYAHHDGTLAGLETSMDASGIDAAVVASIATKPSQNRSILEWCRVMKEREERRNGGPRLFPFPSVHPASSDLEDAVDRVADLGFKGIKIHPYYQDSPLDSPETLALARRAAKRNLILLCHCGYDAAFEAAPVASAKKTRHLMDEVDGLTLVAAHMGGWKDWEDAREYLVGYPVYLDTSFSLQYLSRDVALDFLTAHPKTHLLFGSDSPWEDQRVSLRRLTELGTALGSDRLDAIVGGNARTLLGC